MDTYYEMMRFGAEAVKRRIRMPWSRARDTRHVGRCGRRDADVSVCGRKASLDFVDVINVHFYSDTSAGDVHDRRQCAGHRPTTFPENLRELCEWRDSTPRSCPSG